MMRHIGQITYQTIEKNEAHHPLFSGYAIPVSQGSKKASVRKNTQLLDTLTVRSHRYIKNISAKGQLYNDNSLYALYSFLTLKTYRLYINLALSALRRSKNTKHRMFSLTILLYICQGQPRR